MYFTESPCEKHSTEINFSIKLLNFQTEPKTPKLELDDKEREVNPSHQKDSHFTPVFYALISSIYHSRTGSC
jgi:hypothetical protein